MPTVHSLNRNSNINPKPQAQDGDVVVKPQQQPALQSMPPPKAKQPMGVKVNFVEKPKVITVDVSLDPQSEAMRREGFVQYLDYNVSAKNMYDRFAVLAAMMENYKNSPIKDERKFFDDLQKVSAELKSAGLPKGLDPLVPEEAIMDAFAFIGAMASRIDPNSGLAVSAGSLAFKWMNREFQDSLKKDSAFMDEQVRFQRKQSMRMKMEETLGEVFDLMSKDQKFNQFVQQYFSDVSNGISPSDTLEDIAKKDQQYAQFSKVDELYKKMKAGEIDTETCKKMLSQALREIQDVSVQNRKMIGKVQAAFQARGKEEFVKAERSRVAAEKAELDRVSRIRLEASRSVIGLMGNIIALSGNKEAAQQVVTAGNAFITIADSIGQFSNISSTASGYELNLAGVMLTGNILAGVMGIMSLMDQPQRGPDVLVEHLKSIKDEITQLRKDMRDYFQHIDKKLDRIYDQLIENLRLLAETNVKLDGIRRSVVDLQADIATVEYQIRLMADSIGESKIILDKDLNRCIYGTANYKNPDVNKDRYMACLDTAAQYAAGISKQPIQSKNLRPEDFTPSRTQSLLNSGSLSEKIQLLAYYAARFGNEDPWRMIQSDKFANPHTWMAGASLYLGVFLGWPQFMSENLDTSLFMDRVIAKGEDIQRVVTSLAAVDGEDGKKHVHKAMFEKLLKNYLNMGDMFDAQFLAFEKKYRASHGLSEDFDAMSLWADASAYTGYQPTKEIEYMETPQFFSKLGNYPMMTSDFIPPPYLFAEQLGLGKIVGQYLIRTLPDKNGKRHLFVVAKFVAPPSSPLGDPKANVDLEYPVLTKDYQFNDDVPVGWEWHRQNWMAGFKNAFAQKAVNNPPPGMSSAIDPATGFPIGYEKFKKVVNEQFDVHRKALILEYEAELKKEGPLRTAAMNYDNAKALLQAFFQYGLQPAIEKNESLRGLLFGDDGLVGGGDFGEIMNAMRTDDGINHLNVRCMLCMGFGIGGNATHKHATEVARRIREQLVEYLGYSINHIDSHPELLQGAPAIGSMLKQYSQVKEILTSRRGALH